MKTFILHLEAHDDVTSATDKMGWGKSDRILVVWPKKNGILNRQLDLVLLKRYAARLGSQLAVVSRDPLVRYHAPRLGIPVFTSLTRASNSIWRLPRRFRRGISSNPDFSIGRQITSGSGTVSPARLVLFRPEREIRQLNPIIRFTFFLAGVLSVLLLAAVLLPGAEIHLSPQVRYQEMTVPIKARLDVSKSQLSGLVPLKPISAVVEGRDSLPVTSMQRFPYLIASGEVVFTNMTDQVVEIPLGTTIRNLAVPPQRFEVTSPGRLSAGVGQSLDLPARSLQPGPAGNLPAGSLVAIEGRLGTSVSVTNPLPTTGGSEQLLPAPSQGDGLKLEDRLLDSLEVTALNEMKQRLGNGDILIPESIFLVEVLNKVFEPEAGQPADQLQLQLRAEFSGLSVAKQDLMTLAETLLNTSLPEGFFPVDGTLEIIDLSPPTYQEESADWTIQARRQIQAVVPERLAMQLAQGLTPQAAENRLASSLELQIAPSIKLNPAWWPRVPYIPVRIKVILIPPQPVPNEAQ